MKCKESLYQMNAVRRLLNSADFINMLFTSK
jgi:hypothetical protein